MARDRLHAEVRRSTDRKRLRLVVADDHRDLIEELVELLSADFDVLRSVNDGNSLVQVVSELRPDVAITDFSMPGMNGIEAGRRICGAGICPVILLTMYNDAQLVNSAFEAGVRGYVLKVDAGEELIPAVQQVARGDTYLSQGVVTARR